MLFFFLFFLFSQNWTKCLGYDLEVGIRNADLMIEKKMQIKKVESFF